MKTPTNPTPQTLHELRERVEQKRNEATNDTNAGMSFLLGYVEAIDDVLAILDSMEVKDEKE